MGGFGEGLGQGQVAAEGFEHVLPGAGGAVVAQGDGLPGAQAAHGVGNDAVGGPVATADDVAGPGAGQARWGRVPQ